MLNDHPPKRLGTKVSGVLALTPVEKTPKLLEPPQKLEGPTVNQVGAVKVSGIWLR